MPLAPNLSSLSSRILSMYVRCHVTGRPFLLTTHLLNSYSHFHLQSQLSCGAFMTKCQLESCVVSPSPYASLIPQYHPYWYRSLGPWPGHSFRPSRASCCDLCWLEQGKCSIHVCCVSQWWAGRWMSKTQHAIKCGELHVHSGLSHHQSLLCITMLKVWTLPRAHPLRWSPSQWDKFWLGNPCPPKAKKQRGPQS